MPQHGLKIFSHQEVLPSQVLNISLLGNWARLFQAETCPSAMFLTRKPTWLRISYNSPCFVRYPNCFGPFLPLQITQRHSSPLKHTILTTIASPVEPEPLLLPTRRSQCSLRGGIEPPLGTGLIKGQAWAVTHSVTPWVSVGSGQACHIQDWRHRTLQLVINGICHTLKALHIGMPLT